MPYSLQAYCKPEFFREPPPEWERRLREISAVTDKMAHLRFRFREPKDFWNWPERGVWELYSGTPRHLVSADRALQYERHWSELPKSEQVGRQMLVTNYQHFMWHTQGVDVKRFWVLQGPSGGTPAQYTAYERAILRAEQIEVEEFPLGFFPPCPFDELAVKAVLQRDRFVQVGRQYDDLLKLDSLGSLKAEEQASERLFRDRWLKAWFEQIQPQKEFMQSYLRKSEADHVLPPAPEGLSDKLATWQDEFREHGTVQAPAPTTRALQVAVG